MEDGKKTLNIEDYAINQSSLEQVVLMLVKDQKDEHIQGKWKKIFQLQIFLKIISQWISV